MSEPTLNWHPTTAPLARRYDDIWFINPQIGWAVNSNGHILNTTDGGASWTRQFAVNAHLRCIGFADDQKGWAGTITPARRLFRTNNGGVNWELVTNLPSNAPARICGLSVVNSQVVYASGTNFPTDPPRMMKTVNSGESWTSWEMRPHASILIDTYFVDELHGWVVGGKTGDPNPQTRDNLKPVVLFTEDGGQTWVNRLAGQESDFPFGEWGWKIQFVNEKVGFVSLENLDQAAILKTTDGGLTWTRLAVNDPQGNANLEGIGFLDENHGWVGGWGDRDFESGFSSGTNDGGLTWRNANEIGLFINRFRFFGSPVTAGYASGNTVFKLSSDPVPFPALAAALPAPQLLPVQRLELSAWPADIPIIVPEGTVRLTLDVWNRFGWHVGTLLDEIRPAAGARAFTWDGNDANGRPCPEGTYIVRLTADGEAESAYAKVLRRGKSRKLRWIRYNLRLPQTSPLRSLVIAAAGPTVPIDIPDLSEFKTPLEKAHFLLDTAAEIEHALLVQYLYAAYSLKSENEVSDQQQRLALAEWKPLIIGIAKEEMGHLMTVQNLLRLIGKPPNFEREDFPSPIGLYPFPMRLEPITQESLAKYVIAESPFDAAGISDIAQQATHSTGTQPNHVGALYALLGVVFSGEEDLASDAPAGDVWGSLLRQVRSLALTQEPGPERWHLPDSAFDAAAFHTLASDEEWSPATEIRVFPNSDRQGALAALRDISVQGEGPVMQTIDPRGSHFERFLSIYRGSGTAPPFPPAGGWVPTRDVPINPRISVASDPNAINDARAIDFARMSDLRYALLLGYLQQCYLVDPGLRRMIVGWCFDEMRQLQVFSGLLTAMPRANGGTAVAALPFNLPELSLLHLPGQPEAQWQVHIDRLAQSRALAQQMLDSHSSGNQLLVRLRQMDMRTMQQAQQVQQGTLPIPVRGRWERVRSILDAAVGFGGTGPHGRFWNSPLTAFIDLIVEGEQLIAPPGPARGRNSNLIKALKGESPFDENTFRRMPAGRIPVAPEHIAFIEAWIDAGCPEI